MDGAMRECYGKSEKTVAKVIENSRMWCGGMCATTDRRGTEEFPDIKERTGGCECGLVRRKVKKLCATQMEGVGDSFVTSLKLDA